MDARVTKWSLFLQNVAKCPLKITKIKFCPYIPKKHRGVSEMIEFHVLRAGTYKAGNTNIFKNLQYTHFLFMVA